MERRCRSESTSGGSGTSDSGGCDYNPSASGMSADGVSASKNQSPKICGVCGDTAKSYHFGGLSCDSCKAFFRRSVQNDNYLNFQCCHNGSCLITLATRKSCQYCRMKRCFGIGMEKSWVMTEEERINLMKSRAEKKLHKQQGGEQRQQPDKVTTPPGQPEASDTYQPRVERMSDYLSPSQIKEIEDIVTKYLHSYQHVPYRSELKDYDEDRPGVQVMEMFGTLIRRFAFYSRLIPSFAALTFQNQSTLLKGGVLEMCLLRGALVFDPTHNCWPNINVEMYKDAPRLKLDNIYHITSSRLFQMHMEFIACIQQMNVDEPTVMLVILLVLFTPERTGLTQTDLVSRSQEHYTALLQAYMNWRYGQPKARTLFSRMLTKLSDLRELSDTHNHHNLRLGNEEVSSIQNQLSNLKLNPYPEYKVVSESGPNQTVANNPTPATAATFPAYSSHFFTSNEYHHQPPATQQHPSYPALNVKVETPETYAEMQNTHQHQVYRQQQQWYQQQQQPQQQQPQQFTDCQPIVSLESASTYGYAGYSDCGKNLANSSSSTGSAGFYGAGGSGGEAANMGMQFMKVMQQSISQVLNVPHFGYEWVTPDYAFDAILQQQPQRNEQQPTDFGPVNTSVPNVCKNVTSSYPGLIASVGQPANSGAQRLTPEVMEELYEALEDFVSDQRNSDFVSSEYAQLDYKP